MVSASNFISADKNTLSTSVNAFLPKIAFIPIEEDDSGKAEIMVNEGDRVQEGDVIARLKGLNVHSSLPGLVQKIEQIQYANGKQGLCAKIALNGSFNYLGKKNEAQDWKKYEDSELVFMLKEAGVINTFAKATPLYSQIIDLQKSKGSSLVVRMFDADPSFVTDGFIAKKHVREIIQGAAVLARAFGAKNVLFAYSASEKNGIKALIDEEIEKNRAYLFDEDMQLLAAGVDTRKYPAGTMHDIVLSVRKSNKDGVFSKLSKKDLFVDSVTVLASYNAVVLKKPVVSTFVHVTGECLNTAALLNVRIGTPLRDIVEQCGGFKRKLSKIVINGIISGRAVSSLDIPVNRSVKSVEFIPASKISIPSAENCIRCGNCRKICPVHLWPGNLYRIAHLDSINYSDSDKAAYESVLLCTECGLCNTVCSSRLPLAQTISILKDSYNEK